MSKQRDKMTISFSDYDKDISDFLREQKNASGLIRHLVREYMLGNEMPKARAEKVTEETAVTTVDIKEETVEQPKAKLNPSGRQRSVRVAMTPKNDTNIEAIADMIDL